MRRSSRQKKTISYRDDGSDDDDEPMPQEDVGPEYDQPQEEESDEEVESHDANSDDEDESAPRAPAAAKSSPSISATKGGKAPRKQRTSAKKLKTSLIGMKGLVEYATSDMAGCKVS